MISLHHIALPVVLAAIIGAPTGTPASGALELRGEPSLRQTADSTATLHFALTEQLEGASKGVAQLTGTDRAVLHTDNGQAHDDGYAAAFYADGLTPEAQYAVRILARGRTPRTIRLALEDQR